MKTGPLSEGHEPINQEYYRGGGSGVNARSERLGRFWYIGSGRSSEVRPALEEEHPAIATKDPTGLERFRLQAAKG
ncbi:MAG: hypothetical protein KBD16_02220 [Candidatus Pacebacteria bacterium]|nr:hypothetical protein [Candidatus Paceibacterota bacterium]